MIFNVQDVGVKVSAEELIGFLNDQRSGGFAFIKGYTKRDKPQPDGTPGEIIEVADYYFKAACSYPNIVKRSIEMLDKRIIEAKIVEEGITVSRGVWVDFAGLHHTVKGKDKDKNGVMIQRVHMPITKTYSMDNPDDKRLIDEAIHSVLFNLVNPKKKEQGFTPVAKGTFVKEGEAPHVVYFRDLMLVKKITTMKVEKEDKTASAELSAMKDAILELLPYGKHRCFKLDNNFDYISIEGQALLQGSGTDGWDMLLALKEDVKEAIQEAIMAPVVAGIIAAMDANGTQPED